MSKQVTYVGYSRVNGELKFRTASDEKRIFQLQKLGDTDINIVALPSPMSKNQAAKFALTDKFFAKKLGDGVEALFVSNIKDENPFVAPKKVVVKNAKIKVTPQVPALKGMTPLGLPEADEPMTAKQAAKIRAEFMKKLAKAYNNA